jgi:hypothetical protein
MFSFLQARICQFRHLLSCYFITVIHYVPRDILTSSRGRHRVGIYISLPSADSHVLVQAQITDDLPKF